MAEPALSAAEIRRYARHIGLPDFGLAGQQRLRAGSVLVIGAGGLGAPALLYLAAAGVGRIGIMDPDRVEESNLQRQIVHDAGSAGMRKAESAAARLRQVNPHICVEPVVAAFTAGNALDLVARYDVVLDGSDNFATRYLSSDVCVWAGKPNVYGSIHQWEGQVSVFAPHLGAPCYRCLFPVPPPPGSVPTCAEGGVIGVLPGIVGSLQALEAIKLLSGAGQSAAGRLIHVDALGLKFREIRLRRDPECPVCGEKPTITGPVDYEEFCGVPRTGQGSDGDWSLSAAEFSERCGAGAVVIDVREAWESALAPLDLPGARVIPVPLAEIGTADLPPRPPICVCPEGRRSAEAVRMLRQAGVDARHLRGGTDLLP